jgi:hypothetical protein
VLLAQTTLSLLATLVTPMRVTPVLALGPSDIGVHGDLACPAPERVAARLRPLVPDDVTLPPSATAPGIWPPGARAPGIWIDLRAPGGSGADGSSNLSVPAVGRFVQVVIVGSAGAPDVPIGTVRLDASCDDAVDEAAVLIAAWLGRYETTASAGFDLEPATARSVHHEDLEHLEDREDPDASRQVSRLRGSLGLAAGLVQGLAGPATPQGAVEGVLVRAYGLRRGLVARLSLSVSGTRSLPLGPGSSEWQRLAGVLAVGWRERLGSAPFGPSATTPGGATDGPDGSFFVELSGGPIVADSRISGAGFATDFRSSGIALGLAPAVRIGWNTNPRVTVPFELWLELGCHMWVSVHEVATANPTMSRRLPWLDGVLSLGTSFGLGQ